MLQSKVWWLKKSKAKSPKDSTVCTILSSDCINIVLCIIEQNHIYWRILIDLIPYIQSINSAIIHSENRHYAVSENGKNVFH